MGNLDEGKEVDLTSMLSVVPSTTDGQGWILPKSILDRGFGRYSALIMHACSQRRVPVDTGEDLMNMNDLFKDVIDPLEKSEASSSGDRQGPESLATLLDSPTPLCLENNLPCPGLTDLNEHLGFFS